VLRRSQTQCTLGLAARRSTRHSRAEFAELKGLADALN
jgi:hypothetical protein